jgi:signal transduction histidine kinase
MGTINKAQGIFLLNPNASVRLCCCLKLLVTYLLKISIADNAKGMSEEIKQKIFENLFTTKAVGKGTGLGLAIAKQIVEEKHGGKLEVFSELGLGTEFIIWIPLEA